MSATTVLGVIPDRRPVELLELRNGNGWAPSIWSRLVKHLYGFDGYLFGGEGQKLRDYSRHDAAWWPCATVRVLAAVYASHPDYDPTWAL